MVCDDVSTNRIRLHVFHSPRTTLHSCIATATSAPHCREDRTLQGRPASASDPERQRRKRQKEDSCSKDTKSRQTVRSEEHTSELQSRGHLVCRLLLEKKKIGRTV